MITVPNLDPDTDVLTAALAYANAGFYILPARRGTKDPGSVVGKGWQRQSSRDPKQIVAWLAGTDHGIALHCGRSGAVVFDVDDPDKMPDVLRRNITSAPHQSSRPDVPGRGHYVFAQPPGRTIGNGTGRLGGAWGEVRGLNGVIIAAPSPHGEGGHYQWVRAGEIPALPVELAELLPDATQAEDAASDTQVAAFIAEHTEASRPEILAGWRSALTRHIEAGKSVHESAVSVVTGALKEARAGFCSARDALEALRPIFINAVALGGSTGKVRTGATAKNEWGGILAWAVAQANAADLDQVRGRTAEKMPDAVTVLATDPREPDSDDQDHTPKLWAVSDLRAATQPRWLAKNRIPYSAVSLLVGDEGIGKSLLWVWIFRYVTTGTACTEFGIPAREPGHVVLIVTEDDWATTVLPRLEVAGVNLAMVRVICAEKDGSGSPVFPRDLHLIRDADPPPALAVVDAWLDTVPSRLTVRDPQQAREALHPWKELATTTGAAILLLTHTNRVASGNPRDRYGITGELRKKARLTLFAQADDDGHLIVGPEKANTAATIPASTFTITAVRHFTPTEDHDGTVPLLAYAGDSTQTAREHIAETYAADTDTDGDGDAVVWLAKYLAAGPRWSKRLHDDREAAGISEKKLRTAKNRLRVESRRDGDGPWFMALPEHKDRGVDALAAPVSGHQGIWPSSQVRPDALVDAPQNTPTPPHAPTTCKDSLMTNGETQGHQSSAELCPVCDFPPPPGRDMHYDCERIAANGNAGSNLLTQGEATS